MEIRTYSLIRLLRILKNNTCLNRRQTGLAVFSFAAVLFSFIPFLRRYCFAAVKPSLKTGVNTMNLSPPTLEGNMSLEEAISERRSKRSFSKRPLTEKQLSQVLWAAQGITDVGGLKRSAPSGGALYPSDIYAVIGENCVEAITAGVYLYRPEKHSILKIADGDRRKALAVASLRQMWMADAAVLFVISLEYGRVTGKYGDRGIRYALIESGHIGQNICLQCQALGIASCIVGAFDDQEVAKVVDTGKGHRPTVILPAG